VHGASSELVKESHVKEFFELVPHSECVNVVDARHMVAGDRNDIFSAAILSFIQRLPAAEARSGIRLGTTHAARYQASQRLRRL
jgi:hypothetical protein